MQLLPSASIHIRPIQQRDLETIQQLQELDTASLFVSGCAHYTHRLQDWLTLARVSSLFPHSLRHPFRIYVAEGGGQVLGCISVSPFNSSRSTWRIDRILVAREAEYQGVGTQLIRHCLESCWEARIWLLEVEVNSKDEIALYRHNGFQPLAQLTNWLVPEPVVRELAEHQPDLPNLLPVNNADACLLYQLDTAAMPPQIRQVYDLSINDFRASLLEKLLDHGQHLLHATQEISAYIYEPQRKAAIGYFSLILHRQRSRIDTCHQCHLTVHPAYTWLYPELTAQVGRIVAQQTESGNHEFSISSADYQPEREAYLEQIQAQRTSHGLLMARSVWHKVRESRSALDALHLSRMLSGLQPAQKPVPGRIDIHPPSHPDELP